MAADFIGTDEEQWGGRGYNKRHHHITAREGQVVQRYQLLGFGMLDEPGEIVGVRGAVEDAGTTSAGEAEHEYGIL